MPTLPSEPMTTATASRIHARRESGMNRSESRVKLEEISTAGATSFANAQRSSAMARDIGHADVVGCGVTRLGGTGEWRYFRHQRK
jgi:phage baseplate assembly protein W